MTPRLPGGLAALLLTTTGGTAQAQLVVHDPTNYGSLIQQAQTALNQLNELKAQVSEARRLYDGFNLPSQVNRIAATLQAPELRAFVPDISAYVAAARGDFSALGEIGRKAAEMRETTRLYTPTPGDALGQALEQAGDRAVRDLALGQQAASVGARRLEGLEDLATALDTAPNARAVLDLQARIAAEEAMTANDQLRLQGLAMAQEAEARLQAQQERERSAAERDSRLRHYHRTFQ